MMAVKINDIAKMEETIPPFISALAVKLNVVYRPTWINISFKVLLKGARILRQLKSLYG